MAIGVGQLLGNYRLQSLLGRGGFAEVYLAEHIYLGTHVAIKVLGIQITSVNIELFSKEARIIANLFHPYIMRILNFGIERGIPYLVMDYAPNGTLRQRHPKGTILPIDTIIPYIKQIAPALQYIHERKLIHRDIKPENLLIGREGEILISDFGIAIVAHSTRSLNTEGASGTIYYMAPEQIQGKPRPASDQYALGILVYEWLCGTPPFTGTSMEIGMQHLLTIPPPLSEKLLMVSREVEQVLLTALAKDPHQRFGSIQAFASALEQASISSIGRTICTYIGYSSGMWSHDSKYIACEDVQQYVKVAVHILNAIDGTQIHIFRSNFYEAISVVWKHNIPLIAIARKGEVRLINVLSEHIESIFYVEGYDRVTDISLSPDGEFIALLFCHTIYEDFNPEYDTYVKVEVRFTSNGEIAGTYLLDHTFDDIPDPPIVWSPDSTCIAVCSVEKLHIWEVSTPKVLLLEAYSSIIVWSPDGTRIAADDQNEVKIFDALTGLEILTYTSNPQITINHNVTAIAWSPDGRRIISASYHEEEDQSSNAIVQIWDTSAGENIITRQTSSGSVESLDWSPDGKRIAVGFTKGEIQIWFAS